MDKAMIVFTKGVLEGLYNSLAYLLEKALQIEDRERVAYLEGELSGVRKSIEALEKVI